MWVWRQPDNPELALSAVCQAGSACQYLLILLRLNALNVARFVGLD